MPQLKLAPANPKSIVQGGNWRLSILTPALIRLEWSAKGEFSDAQTQIVTNRDFPETTFTYQRLDQGILLNTESLLVDYDGRAFSPAGLHIKVKSKANTVWSADWRYGDPIKVDPIFGNLGGTARTLDGVDGQTELEPGLLSRAGYSLIDDSRSLAITADDWVMPRAQNPGEYQDIYFFGYASDFQQTLRDYFNLTGASPLIPRFALGNWWSRYWPYTDTEYLSLMDRFHDEGVPLSVAVLDMDWHLVDIDPSIGTGWTGYTWNTELFPNHVDFLRQLHRRDLAVTLNVHPADGIRRHEAQYREVAEFLGQNPATGEPVDFQVTNPKFMEAYFDLVHHPLEDEGVDFWWVDWQQGTASALPGLDPLWMLNYLHYRDAARRLPERPYKSPLILSRYCGPGSHRYPVGFSGDTIMSWDSLEFQPYFTATAANIGYFWWSHDIGGHAFGNRDFELSTRWLQFGVFSPINRLHSTLSPFLTKEPWAFPQPYSEVQKTYLRLRHAMIPYLYTQMWASHRDDRAPIRPIYHDYPDVNEAYRFTNSYFFGDLLVSPVTSPEDPTQHLAHTRAWIPEGTWRDLFTGYEYRGPAVQNFHRGLSQLPVLLPAGTILTLAPPEIAAQNHPETLVLWIYLDENGSARGRLIEELGNMFTGDKPAEINIQAHLQDNTLVIEFATHELPTDSSQRKIIVCLPQIENHNTDPLPLDCGLEPGVFWREFDFVSLADGKIALENLEWKTRNPTDLAYAIIDKAECAVIDKEKAWVLVQRHDRDGWCDPLAFSAELMSESLPAILKDALLECVLGVV